jgi:hypothetical protein
MMTPNQEHQHMMDCLRLWDQMRNAETQNESIKLRSDIVQLTEHYTPIPNCRVKSRHSGAHLRIDC